MIKSAIDTSLSESVYIPEVALFGFHKSGLDEVLRLFVTHFAIFGANGNEHLMYVLGHVILVSADVKIPSTANPFPDFLAILLHEVLDVDFLGACPGPCEIVPIEYALVLPFLHLFPVVILPFFSPITEE